MTTGAARGPGRAPSGIRLDGGYCGVGAAAAAFGDEPARPGVNYWAYDPEARRFRIVFVSAPATGDRWARWLDRLARV